MKTAFRSILILLVLFSGRFEAIGQDANEVLAELRETYSGIAVLRASFNQQITSPFGDESPQFEGTIYLSGDRYRIETEFQTFVTDGYTTWIYNEYENQVLINDFVEDETTFSINRFLNEFQDAYQVDEISAEDQGVDLKHVLSLSPLDEDTFFRQVTLWVRDENSMVTRLKVVDVNEAILDFQLDAIEINPALDFQPFTFLPPDTADIIDLRS